MTITVVLITGANNGIGFHMSRTLLENGYHVAAFDLEENNLVELSTTFPENLIIRKCDITDASAVKEGVEMVVQKWNSVDILVNNACLCVFESFENRSLERTHAEFEVNYYGEIHMIQAVLPHMKARGNGIIHNVSSGVGISGFPGIYGYASTKGAIESLTRTLALELASFGICINLMHPPLTNTKSASPLGVPTEMMADPAKAGRSLARQILSKKPVIASDFQTRVYLFILYRYPGALGRLFSSMAAKNTERKK